MSRRPSRGELSFGFRGEGITYRLGGRALEVGFSYMGGPRLYAEGIGRWSDGTALTDDEKAEAFQAIVRFVKAAGGKPTVVVNGDDPSAATWERLCADNRRFVAGIERSSDEQQLQLQRSMYLLTLQAGKGLTIDDTRITTEGELDDYLRTHRTPRRR
ncbi:MAG TPA: hypothetical protein VGD77_11185 [Gemmatimonadaceae bacterium]